MRMKRWVGLLLAFGFGMSLVQAALDLAVHFVRFPERRTVDLVFVPTDRIPGAEMKGKVRFEEGQSRIEVSYEKMKPAVLFGGDVTCYVLWAINRDGTTENLGELWVRPGHEKDTLRFSTGLRSFALLVTAEAYYQVDQPSELVIFRNAPSSDTYASTETANFGAFAPPPKHGLETLGIVQYAGETPLDLVQAEKAFEIAGRIGAEKYAGHIYAEARLALEQARQVARTAPRARSLQEYARKSVASSNEAIKVTRRRLEEEDLERRIAQRRLEMESLEQRAARAEADAQRLEQEVRESQQRLQEASGELARIREEKLSVEKEKEGLEQALAQLRAEREALSRSIEELQRTAARLQQEKAALNVRLEEALSKVADTRNSARGFIVNLPDILFDVNEATLKPEARVVLAKLAGILLILPDLNLRIEGHTDSTGSAEYNLRLSQRRSFAVLEFLAEQGVSSERMTSVGYGMERPVADNSTADGRRRNRRVEIIISEGPILEEAG